MRGRNSTEGLHEHPGSQMSSRTLRPFDPAPRLCYSQALPPSERVSGERQEEEGLLLPFSFLLLPWPPFANTALLKLCSAEQRAMGVCLWRDMRGPDSYKEK